MVEMLSEKETRRKIIHLILGTALSVPVYAKIIDVAALFAMLFLAITISFLSKRSKIPIFSWILKNFERGDALKKFPGKGVVYFLLGSLISMVTFGTEIGAASMVITSLGDSVAPLVGQYGKIKNPFSRDKYIEGTLAGILVAFVGATLFVSYAESFAASFFAMVAEGLDLKLFNQKIDDNITIPVVAGVVIFLLRYS